MSRLLSRKRVLGGLAAAGMLAVGLAAPTAASAEETPSPAPSTSGSAKPDGDTAGDRDRPGAEHRNRLAEELATELGVPQDRIEDALTKIKERMRAEAKERPDAGKDDDRKGALKERQGAGTAAEREAAFTARIDQAVKDGKLSQEQADAILAAVKAGVLPGRAGPGVGPAGAPEDKPDAPTEK
ncbi:hypothetical protein [Plantactinospora sp. CA-290183]|uniref:hypothetical protein n=1 Tax=Plantactinospora sp. CA-290183 TaxID=3240006 RepID=UPI003D909015